MDIKEDDGILKMIESNNKLREVLNKRSQDAYSEFKDNPAVQRLIEFSSDSGEDYLMIKEFKEIDNFLKNGGSYSNAFDQFTYSDCFIGHHALLSISEVEFNIRIESPEQWHALTHVDIEKLKSSYCIAQDARYSMALTKILEEGGKYKDLLAINPQDFWLPDEWEGLLENVIMTKDKMILQAIGMFINSCANDSLMDINSEPPSLKMFVEKIEAPYSIVQEASERYSF